MASQRPCQIRDRVNGELQLKQGHFGPKSRGESVASGRSQGEYHLKLTKESIATVANQLPPFG
ncbi:hypothetical protein TSMEX_003365 [Taenia solium]|eukprot:TsM_000770600 transcript=TsM_000770600 gene=TsM_000770600